MQRHLSLIRSLLFEIEATPAGQEYSTENSEIPRTTLPELNAHLLLLADAGFIDSAEPFGDGLVCGRMTWEGHEFLDLARDQSRWNKALKALAERGTSVALSVLHDLLNVLARKSLGL
jgi:hypothetical protein